MSKMNYDKNKFKGKPTFNVDGIDRNRKKLSKEQKAARKKRALKTRFINKVAEKLQNNTPKSEIWFKSILESQGLSGYFMENIPLNDMIPDFINLDKRIVIEVDGSVHTNAQQIQRDTKKDKEYKRLGYKCFRVIHNDKDQALSVIQQILLLVNEGI